MSEVNLVYQMYNTLSKSDKMRFMQMLGMPPQMTEIIDSSTMEEFLEKYRFHNGVCCPHCGLVDVKKNGKTKTGHQRLAKVRLMLIPKVPTHNYIPTSMQPATQ